MKSRQARNGLLFGDPVYTQELKTGTAERNTTMGPVRIRHTSLEFGWQSSHSMDLAGWQAKMASIEIWISWRNAHEPNNSNAHENEESSRAELMTLTSCCTSKDPAKNQSIYKLFSCYLSVKERTKFGQTSVLYRTKHDRYHRTFFYLNTPVASLSNTTFRLGCPSLLKYMYVAA